MTDYDIVMKNSRWKRQVNLFFGLRENKEDIVYFWIFLPDEIFSIKLKMPYDIIDWNIDVPDYFRDSDGSIPKCLFGKLEKRYNKSDLPESFSNTNSNQKYNRQTIVELDGIEKEVANRLIQNITVNPITIENRLHYLSPLQFETLIFLIFVENNIYCSTSRGGTKEKYDLLIENKSEVFPEFENGRLNIQIKKNTFLNHSKSDSKTIFIYLGETKSELKVFGVDWIISKIKYLDYVNCWLEKSLEFFYN